MRLRGVALVTALALTFAAVFCGGGPDREAISTEVATEWVQDSVDLVSEVVVELLNVSPALRDALDRMPQSKALLARLVAGQISDNIAWSYSAPVKDGEALYRVTATAAMELEIGLPLIGDQVFAVTLPFNLLVDTDARAVDEWGVDLENAAVASY